MVTRVDDNIISLIERSPLEQRLKRRSSTASLLMEVEEPRSDVAALTLRKRDRDAEFSSGLSFHRCLTKSRKRDAVRSLISCNLFLIKGELLTNPDLQQGELAYSRLDKTIKEVESILPRDVLNAGLNVSTSDLTQFCQDQVQNDPMRIGLSPELLQQLLLVYRAACKLSKATEEARLESATELVKL